LPHGPARHTPILCSDVLLTYPERLAYQLLYDLVVAAQCLGNVDSANEHALNDQLQPKMRELMQNYSNPEIIPRMTCNIDMQQPARKSRKSMLLGLIGFVLLVAIIIAAVVMINQNSGTDSKKITGMEPTPETSPADQLANTAIAVRPLAI